MPAGAGPSARRPATARLAGCRRAARSGPAGGGSRPAAPGPARPPTGSGPAAGWTRRRAGRSGGDATATQGPPAGRMASPLSACSFPDAGAADPAGPAARWPPGPHRPAAPAAASHGCWPPTTPPPAESQPDRQQVVLGAGLAVVDRIGAGQLAPRRRCHLAVGHRRGTGRLRSAAAPGWAAGHRDQEHPPVGTAERPRGHHRPVG
jgi:hypothetical protein